jgi:gamma-glutamyltranspeptidase / glutathione hydrolase
LEEIPTILNATLMTSFRLLLAYTLLLAASTANPQALAPEAASGWTEKRRVQSTGAMVATAHPLASQVALETLKRGGTALDAAIAAQMMLGLVEPQSSGIGGGAFLMYYDSSTRKVHAWDGREKAPLHATNQLFYGAHGKPLNFHEAIIGGRAVGAPGLVRMLEQAHTKHGRLPWASLILPTAQQAEQGFPIGPRLHSLLKGERFLKLDTEAAAYFYQADGSPKPIGHVLQNPQLAATLRSIASEGALAMARGPIAHAMIEKVQSHAKNPGLLDHRDLIAYQARERTPVCIFYRSYRICGMPAPSSGGIAVAQTLALLEHATSPSLTANAQLTAAGVHSFAQASRLAFADRNAYVADPDFVAPAQGMLAERYLRGRAQLLQKGRLDLQQAASPGNPRPQVQSRDKQRVSAILNYPESGTTHISIVDKQGNAVAMTSTIEDQFGARQWVQGFLLNNQLSDFSFLEKIGTDWVANRVEPGKRPRSSMAPTLVFDRHGQLVLTTGSPGGSAIIPYVAKVLSAHLRDGLDIQEAINLPNIGNRNGATEIEKGRIAQDLQEQLAKLGHTVRVAEMTSGIQGISIARSGHRRLLTGGADPRREGLVLGY